MKSPINQHLLKFVLEKWAKRIYYHTNPELTYTIIIFIGLL